MNQELQTSRSATTRPSGGGKKTPAEGHVDDRFYAAGDVYCLPFVVPAAGSFVFDRATMKAPEPLYVAITSATDGVELELLFDGAGFGPKLAAPVSDHGASFGGHLFFTSLTLVNASAVDAHCQLTIIGKPT